MIVKFSVKSIFQELLDVFNFRAKFFQVQKIFTIFFFSIGNVLKRTQKYFEGWEYFGGGWGVGRGVCVSYCITDPSGYIAIVESIMILSKARHPGSGIQYDKQTPTPPFKMWTPLEFVQNLFQKISNIFERKDFL